MADWMKIARLKLRAAIVYKRYMDATEHLDCGHAIAQVVSLDAAKYAAEFDAIMDQLAEIDKNCPKTRLRAE